MALHTSFNPDAATHLALLNDWMDSTIPLSALADRYQTTIAELCFFFARPEIAAQLSLLHAAAYDRARLAATTHLDVAISALALLVHKFLAQQASPNPNLTPDQQRRTEEIGRRAATILLRFIKNKPSGLGTPTLRGGSAAFDPSTSPSSAAEPPQAQQAGGVTERVPPAPAQDYNQAPASPAPSPQTSTHAAAPEALTDASPTDVPAEISTTELAQAALEALAEFQHAAASTPAPPSASFASPHPPSDIPRPTFSTGPPTRAAA